MREKQTFYDRVVVGAETILHSLIDAAATCVGDEDGFASPIEYWMAVSMMLVSSTWYDKNFVFMPERCLTARKIKQRHKDQKTFGVIYPEVLIGHYRVDFMIECRDSIAEGVVVECDGHEFHEKTKEQAAKDKARDRFLTQLGFRVLRFTGSEIWNNPVDLAVDALGLAHELTMERSLLEWRRGYSKTERLNEDDNS